MAFVLVRKHMPDTHPALAMHPQEEDREAVNSPLPSLLT